MRSMKKDAEIIIKSAIQAMLPDAAVKAALAKRVCNMNMTMIAIGKAAWPMAYAAKEVLQDRITNGIVITKYGHAKTGLDGIEVIETGHPVLDRNTIIGTEKALKLISGLPDTGEVLFLVSGGGSALFEKLADGISLQDMEEVTKGLLACGADIVEVNTIRKRLSAVKGGRFAELVSPNKIFTIVLSDVIGDRLDTIASGPAYPDQTSSQDVADILQKYHLEFAPHVMEKLQIETPKLLQNVETVITGSVKAFCEKTADMAKSLGYEPTILTSSLGCEAKEAGRFMAAIAREIRTCNRFKTPCAIIAGGETTVHVTGYGKGGRNQELALSAANEIDGLPDTLLFSVGSDGTDGPTDAAGGMVDGSTKARLREKNINIDAELQNNASYKALKEADGLVMTGPTGTNVNDVAVLLCR